MGGDDGEDVEEGLLEGGARLLGWSWVAEEGRDGVSVGYVGRGGCGLDAEAEEGWGCRGGGGGGCHGSNIMNFEIAGWSVRGLCWLEEVMMK